MSDSFDGLYEKLARDKDWPKVYLFKFIIPSDNHRLALVQSLFGPEAQVSLNQSREGKYVSVSAKEIMMSPEEVIQRYKSAQEIEGLISL